MAIQSNFPALKPSLMLDFANTKQLDPRITYTRASTATFYNGVTTAMAEQNLLTYSQQFDNAAWVKTNATITADSTTAPDGTTTADTLTLDAGSALNKRAYQALTAVTAAFTVSIYAKTGTYNVLQIFTVGGSNSYANFDLTAGTVGTVGSGNTSSITSVGNGWYRCVLNLASVSSSNVNFAAVDSTSAGYAATTSATGTLFLWGAQLEQRSAVSAYTATTTQAITNYIPVLQTAASGVARFDNNPTTGESLGLLIEESRTNLITYSSQFDDGAWSKVNSCTITANTIVAPDGTLTGDKLVRDSAASAFRIQQTTSVTSGTAYTFTCYAKASQLSWLVLLSQSSFPVNTQTWFNLSSGVVGTIGSGVTSASITSVGNGWYRCSITATANATAASAFQVQIAPSDNTFTFTSGNTFDGLFIWGAQFEAGAFATSYIPTVASQVTRAADAASMTGTNFSSWFNAGEGSFYSFDKATASGQTIFSATDGTTNNAIVIKTSVSAGAYVFNMVTNGTSVVQMNTAGTANSKYSYAYKFNDCAGSVDGGTVTTDTVATVPVVNQLVLGGGYGSVNLNGTINKIAYYPIRLSNTNLVALTS